MKKLLTYLFVGVFILFFPFIIFAHGGVEKRVGNILVTLFQTPLSPLVGEHVAFSFILTDPSATNRMVHKAARLVVTKTAYGDPRNDKIVYTKEVTSDINGTINFTYTFPSTNYYDIDLQFGKPNDEENSTGFLVQPRENLQLKENILLVLLIISIISNIGISSVWIIRKRMYRNKS